MLFFSEATIVEKIRNREIFTATIEGGAFTLKINKYVPVLSTAMHNGGQLSQDLADNCLLSQKERYYEEDPHTGSFIENQEITMIAHDSRYEYDLNRKPDECVYETAWGKEIWQTARSRESITASQEKHAQFHRVITAVIEALREDFGRCLVYDIHSYNYQRYERTDLPVFNLGTSTVTNEKWRPVITTWLSALQRIQVDGVETTVAENDIFNGKGYLTTYCHNRYDNVLVLATEVKKVFMNELTGEPDVEMLESLQKIFNATVSQHSERYVIS